MTFRGKIRFVSLKAGGAFNGGWTPVGATWVRLPFGGENSVGHTSAEFKRENLPVGWVRLVGKHPEGGWIFEWSKSPK